MVDSACINGPRQPSPAPSKTWVAPDQPCSAIGIVPIGVALSHQQAGPCHWASGISNRLSLDNIPILRTVGLPIGDGRTGLFHRMNAVDLLIKAAKILRLNRPIPGQSIADEDLSRSLISSASAGRSRHLFTAFWRTRHTFELSSQRPRGSFV